MAMVTASGLLCGMPGVLKERGELDTSLPPQAASLDLVRTASGSAQLLRDSCPLDG